jgi:hypothetical protein
MKFDSFFVILMPCQRPISPSSFCSSNENDVKNSNLSQVGVLAKGTLS